MPTILLETSAYRVTRDGEKLVFHRKTSSMWLVFVLTLLAAGIFYGLAYVIEAYEPALAAFSRWAAWAIALMSPLSAVRAIGILLTPKSVVDASRGTVTFGRTEHALATASEVRAQTVHLASLELVELVVEIAGRPMKLLEGVPEERRADVQAIAATIDAMRTGISRPPRDVVHDASATASLTRAFTSTLLVVFGGALVVVGYVVMPDLLLTSRGASFGTRLWPLGFVLLAVALVRTLDARLARGIPRGVQGALIGTAVVLYLALAYVPL